MARASVTLEWLKLTHGDLVDGFAVDYAYLTVNGHQLLYQEDFGVWHEVFAAHGGGSNVEVEVDTLRVLVAGSVSIGRGVSSVEQFHVVSGTYVLVGEGWRARYRVVFS